MASDLVERLLKYDKREDWSHIKHPAVCLEAADRIEALEKALREVYDLSMQRSVHPMSAEADYFRIAHKALGKNDV